MNSSTQQTSVDRLRRDIAELHRKAAAERSQASRYRDQAMRARNSIHGSMGPSLVATKLREATGTRPARLPMTAVPSTMTGMPPEKHGPLLLRSLRETKRSSRNGGDRTTSGAVTATKNCGAFANWRNRDGKHKSNPNGRVSLRLPRNPSDANQVTTSSMSACPLRERNAHTSRWWLPG